MNELDTRFVMKIRSTGITKDIEPDDEKILRVFSGTMEGLSYRFQILKEEFIDAIKTDMPITYKVLAFLKGWDR